MTAEAIAFFGCGRSEQLDIWNCARTLAYVRNHSVTASRLTNACCPDTADWLPEAVSGPYTNPVDDDAWWYDVFRPESAGFFGLQVTKVTGLDKDTIDLKSTSTLSCDNRIVHAPTVYKGATITVEGVLHGLTCCAVAYGLRALRKQLLGCCGDDQCRGTRLRFIGCVPQEPDACGTWLPPTETTSPWRTLTNVRVAELPAIVDGSGASCGTCGCKPMTKVMFTLRSNSDLYLDSRVILPPTLLLPGGVENCDLACDDAPCEDSTFMNDPLCDQPILVPPSDASLSCFCPPLMRSQQCFTVDLGARMFDSDIEVEIYSGATDLRNLEVRVWKQVAGLDYDPILYTRCNACTGFTVSFIPGATTLVRDMCGITATRGMKKVQAAQVFAGVGGRFSDGCLRLSCGTYIICIFADVFTTPADATITMRAREFEP